MDGGLVQHQQDFVPKHCGEEEAKSEGKDLDLQFDLCSDRHLWSQALGRDRMREDSSCSFAPKGASQGGFGHLIRFLLVFLWRFSVVQPE